MAALRVGVRETGSIPDRLLWLWCNGSTTGRDPVGVDSTSIGHLILSRNMLLRKSVSHPSTNTGYPFIA
ncbi:hypothetical protein LCGC14_0475620 [marine sediment metagenome]|uniref:Uncharacterized protein n=1 Tax=marine sediment metagenome TaxID=412755 RepID=A0A0F9SG98_9ZZZZ